MENFERELIAATSDKHLPGTIVAAANREGTFNYLKCFGNTSLAPDAPPVTEASTFCLASATKLVTSVAAMQCVERGLISLDEDVAEYLTEWKDAVILKGIDEGSGEPILVRAERKITLRHLLTHTSGISGFENEEIMAYYNAIGDSKGTLISRYFTSQDPVIKAAALEEMRVADDSFTVEPLIFEPGTGWVYGMSTDWAGKLVETLTHQTLESYCRQNIFTPLHMTSTTFRLLHPTHPHIQQNLLSMTSRTPSGTLTNVPSLYPLNPVHDMGGSNLYSSAPDFLALLKSLLKNDGVVLKRETVDEMFDARLVDKGVLGTEKARGFLEGMVQVEREKEWDHCLAGLVNEGVLGTGRRGGGVTWQGATKCFWWIDRESGLCGFYGSQLIGGSDKGASARMNDKFEKAVYDDYGGSK
ncbi:beta-lactamase [Rhexocercosporidium sp. MPI-PUGE-AT-0058]|nr:beta-lactamase [Rhexocercosporidium sp. MPI-PUGE-AT-0058]